MKRYWTYSQRFIIDWTFAEDRALNWYYDLSFFLDYPSYQLPTLTVRDWIKTNSNYFLVAEYDENVLTEQNISDYIASIPAEFNLSLFSTVEEARQYLRDNTELLEETIGVFVLNDEYTKDFVELVPKQTLTIE